MNVRPSILIISLVGASSIASAQMRMADSVVPGNALSEVRVADIVERVDGHTLTLGSRFDDQGLESTYLVLRDPAGERKAVVGLAIDPVLAYEASSLLSLPDGHVAVLSVEYDPQDFSADRALVLSRLDPALRLIWSVRVDELAMSFESARLSQSPDGHLVVFGEVVRTTDGERDMGDGMILMIDADDGSIIQARTLGTIEGHERIADLQPGATAGSWVVLAEISRRSSPTTVEWADALLAVAGDASITRSRLIGHEVGNGIRIQPMRLLPAKDGFVIAGRRTAFGPNFFYLHAIGADLAPAQSRVLVPLFNAIDVDVRDQSLWVYGEANGEAQDSGTVLMRFDEQVQLLLQRRFGTRNTTFPTGAMTFAGDNAVLALGANASDENLVVYEAVHSVRLSDGEGLLCEEGDYDGFTPTADSRIDGAAWAPLSATLEIRSSAVDVTVVDIEARSWAMCVVGDDRVFTSGFERDPT